MTDTILIVDDSSFIVEGLVAILKKSYRTLAVFSGPQCLDILQKEKPAIIILDIMMEPMDGWETLSRIKENPATRHIPVLMFSAKKISAEEAEEHRISIDDFVSKPVTTKKLIEAIEKVLARQKANRLSIESWKSAGIGPERIDEFTSLMTNLEVDMSLLQNMKVQLSLVHDNDNKSRKDFEAVITAIESRIQEERRHEEELSSEMQQSVAKDAEVKERAGPVPAINENGLVSLPVGRGAESAVQPEFTESHEITVKEIHKIPEVRLPDTAIIPETTDSDFLFENESSELSPSENTEQEIPAEYPHNQPEHDTVLSGMLSRIETPKPNIATHPLSPETLTGNFSSGVNISSDKQVLVTGQKSPSRPVPIPLSAKTSDKKPVAPNVPIPTVVGSGTDITLRMSPSSLGRTEGTLKDNPFMPSKKVASPSGGFFSKIISMIIGIFKRH